MTWMQYAEDQHTPEEVEETNDAPKPDVSMDAGASIGVGSHSEPWPKDDHFDPALLRDGDRRNVIDRYRYWKVSSIVADLDARRHPFHVAIENWQHDRNIGTIVRTANAFAAARVHIVGRRRWNRRGAMMTDVYQHLQHHNTINDLIMWAQLTDLPLIGVDNMTDAVPIEHAVIPERCVLLFGQEGPGLSTEARQAASQLISITQYGSTRSLNVGVAAGIVMHSWIRQWVRPSQIGETPTTRDIATTHKTDTPREAATTRLQARL